MTLYKGTLLSLTKEPTYILKTDPHHKKIIGISKILSFKPNNHKQSHSEDKYGLKFSKRHHQWHHQWHRLLSDVCIIIFACCKQNTDDIIKGGLLMDETCDSWWNKLTNGIIHVISINQSEERVGKHVIFDATGLLMKSFMWFPPANQEKEMTTCDSWRCKLTNGTIHVISINQSEKRIGKHVNFDDAGLLMESFMWFPPANQKSEIVYGCRHVIRGWHVISGGRNSINRARFDHRPPTFKYPSKYYHFQLVI